MLGERVMRAMVTQRESVGPHGNLIDSLEREYVDLLADRGFEVFPVSNFAGNVKELYRVVEPKLVLLTGGGAVQLSAYAYPIQTAHQVERDGVEDGLISLAINDGVPVVGICRGMQKLNAYFGGKIRSFEECPFPRIIREPHPVELVDGERFIVNNFHVNGVFPDTLGEGLEAVALDPDNGTVEAMQHANYGVFAVQWHPERMKAGERGRVWFESILDSLTKTSPKSR